MQRSHLAIVGLALTLSAVAAGAQAPSYKRDIPDSLAKRAKISEDSATAMAKKRVPKGEIQSVELEKEKGRLIYSFDMKVSGRSGVSEVNINAMTGKVVSVHHESAAAERKEAAQEKKDSAARKRP